MSLRPLIQRPAFLGAYPQSLYPNVKPERHFHGDMDEVRVSNVARSEAWLTASYHNQKPGSTLLRLAPLESNAAWLPRWPRRHRLALNPEVVEADLTNFPVLVRLTADNFDFARAAPDGADIRFMSGDSRFFLDFERESHDAISQTAAYWVRIPQVSSTSPTPFYLYYGNRDVSDGASPAAVWDAGHVGVWHLHEINGVTQADSTAAGNHLEVNPGGLDHEDVLISGCDDLNGWSATGPYATLALDTVRRDTVRDSEVSIALSVTASAAGQTNTLVYQPAAPLALGNRRLNFAVLNNKSLSSGFGTARVYIYDTAGNYRYCDLKTGISHGSLDRTDASTRSYDIIAGGTIGGVAPDLNAIARLEWVLVSADDLPYIFNVDSLNANGALDEGMPGVIAEGVTFTGFDHYLITKTLSLDTTNGLTLSTWVRPHYKRVSWPWYSPFLGLGDGNWSPYYSAYLAHRSSQQIEVNSGISKYDIYPDGVGMKFIDDGLVVDEWRHVAAVIHYDAEASNTTMKVYLNGVLKADLLEPGRALRPLLERPLYVGAATQSNYNYVPPQYHFNGDMDEVRVSNVRRSGAWVKASFLNQQAEDELLIFGHVEPPPGTLLLLR